MGSGTSNSVAAISISIAAGLAVTSPTRRQGFGACRFEPGHLAADMAATTSATGRNGRPLFLRMPLRVTRARRFPHGQGTRLQVFLQG
jgi:hypothetical protein